MEKYSKSNQNKHRLVMYELLPAAQSTSNTHGGKAKTDHAVNSDTKLRGKNMICFYSTANE